MSELPNPTPHPVVVESQVDVERADRRVELKVKIKSLAAEARVIRTEESKAKARGDRHKVNSLHNHRVGIVRNEARLSLLCYAMLRGRTYAQVEPRHDNSTRPPKTIDVNKLKRLARSFGVISEQGAHMQVTNWLKGKAS